jgi:hypothetical protein
MMQDPCRTCEIIMNIALHHFNNNITDKDALQMQLREECRRLAQFEGQNASMQCTMIVNDNIDKIFMDLSMGAGILYTCQDLMICGPDATSLHPFSMTPTLPAMKPIRQQRRVKRQMPQDPCRTCEIIMNIALYHFHNNVTDKDALLVQLQEECRRLGDFQGPNASAQCRDIVTMNIDKIFMDLSSGAGILYTCQDLMICGADATTIHFPMSTPPTPPAQHRFKRQATMSTTFFPHDPCRTCELVMNIAIHHFANGITDKAALLAQLLVECDDPIGTHDGPMAADNCKQIVNDRIDQIFDDLSNGTSPRRTCVDLHYCRGRVVNRVKRQMAPEPCRLCEIIVNTARYHFHNNITDETALMTQLQAECANFASMQGQAWADACTALVNAKGHQIYMAMANHENGRRTCMDIGECHGMTTMFTPLKRVKRQMTQRPHNPCRTCEIIMNIAVHHFNNGINDKPALLAQLLTECTRLGQNEGPEAAAHCTDLVNNNIDTIYTDLSTGKHPRQTCVDIHECNGMMTTMSPPLKRVKRQAHDPCRVCETLMAIARRHFHNNITDETALGVQLHMECDNLGMNGFTTQEVQNCNDQITAHLHDIFLELSNNPNLNVRQVCQAFGRCPTPTPPTVRRVKRQMGGRNCRTCEIVMNFALHHFHDNITDQAALQDELFAECRRIANLEGQAQAQHCHDIVQNNIAKIFSDLQNTSGSSDIATAHHTCVDIQECNN